MPRTRKSSRLNQNDTKARTTTTEQNVPPVTSPVKTNAKKRTVSDRSPVMKTRKKAANYNREGKSASHYEGDIKEGLNGEENKENVKEPPLTPGVTPYWKAVEENGGVMSPRLTRSAKKKGRLSFIPRYQDSPVPHSNTNTRRNNNTGTSNSGIFQMAFSPPNETEIRKRESKLEKERKARLQSRKRQDGCVMYLSPNAKQTGSKQGYTQGREDSRGEDPPEDCSNQDDEEFCFEVHSKEKNDHVEGDMSPLSKGSDEEPGVQARVHELEKMQATLEAGNNFLRSQLHEEREKVEKLENENKNLTIQVAKSVNNLEMKDIIQNSVEEIRRTANTGEKSVEIVESDYRSRLAIAERGKMKLLSAFEEERKKANETIAGLVDKIKLSEEKYCNALTIVKDKLQVVTEKNESQIRSALKEKESYETKTNEKLFNRMQEYDKKIEILNETIAKTEEDHRKEVSEKDQVFNTLKATEKENLEMQKTLQNITNEKNELLAELERLQNVFDDKAKAFKDMELNKTEKESELLAVLDKERESESRFLLLQNRLTDKEKEQKHSEETLKKSFHEKEELMAEEISRMKLEQDKVVKNEEDMKTKITALEMELQSYKKTLEKQQSDYESLTTKAEEESEKMKATIKAMKMEGKSKQDTHVFEIKEKENEISLINKRLRRFIEQEEFMEMRMSTFDAREGQLCSQIQSQDEARRSLHNRVMQLSGNIRVYVRVRPCIANESAVGKEIPFNFPALTDRQQRSSSLSQPSTSSSEKSCDDLTKSVIVATEPEKDRGGLNPRRKKWKFGFDNVFTPEHGQEDVWRATEPLVQSAIDGWNVTVFAYGQTGSGKTFTMLGNKKNPGIVKRSIDALFEAKERYEVVSRGELQVEIHVELVEIYNEQVKDLLASGKKNQAKNPNLGVNGNEVVGNVVYPVSKVSQVQGILDVAQKCRIVKATKSNEESSRSHLIFTMIFTVLNKSGVCRKSRLNICDLAGSERLSKSESAGSTLKETQYINKSLSALSNVIEKLQQKSQHVPFRESKLTYLLRDSLAGDSKTLALICCNPLAEHFNESNCSLRFGNKLSKVELKAMGNFKC